MFEKNKEQKKKSKRIKFNHLLPKRMHRPFIIAVTLATITVIFSIVVYSSQQPKIPLFYSLSLAKDHLVDKQWVFLLPALAIIINILNFSIVKLFQNTNKLILSLMANTTVFFQLICLATIIRLAIIIS